MLSFIRGFDNHVIDIHLNFLTYLIGEHTVHEPLVCYSYIFNPKRHDVIIVVSHVRYERCFCGIVRAHPNLIASKVGIHKTQCFENIHVIYEPVGSVYGSLGHTLLGYVKSTHIHHFPEFFFTITMLANHVEYLIYWKTLKSRNFLLSLPRPMYFLLFIFVSSG